MSESEAKRCRTRGAILLVVGALLAWVPVHFVDKLNATVNACYTLGGVYQSTESVSADLKCGISDALADLFANWPVALVGGILAALYGAFCFAISFSSIRALYGGDYEEEENCNE